MIHYHGSPITPESAAAQIMAGRHAMVSFSAPEQLPLIAEVCQSFVLDNGAFSAWRKGSPINDWDAFYEWVEEWRLHPAFDWFLIPDEIDGTESQNDRLLERRIVPGGVPIWHLHEGTQRLERLIGWGYNRIALGSSGGYATIGTQSWWGRMAEAMKVLCDERGFSRVKLHGLRMLAPEVFSALPFSSADSTNVARNVGLDTRWKGPYAPAGKAARGIVIAGRIEAHQSAPKWISGPQQQAFLLNMGGGE